MLRGRHKYCNESFIFNENKIFAYFIVETEVGSEVAMKNALFCDREGCHLAEFEQHF